MLLLAIGSRLACRAACRQIAIECQSREHRCRHPPLRAGRPRRHSAGRAQSLTSVSAPSGGGATSWVMPCDQYLPSGPINMFFSIQTTFLYQFRSTATPPSIHHSDTLTCDCERACRRSCQLLYVSHSLRRRPCGTKDALFRDSLSLFTGPFMPRAPLLRVQLSCRTRQLRSLHLGAPSRS